MKTIAIVGRPNVGKSTLFNRLTRTKNALVVDMPGVTRDRQYGHAYLNDHVYQLVDTGGIGVSPDDPLFEQVVVQTQYAIDEADLILWVVDARTGLTPADERVGAQLRACNKPVFLIANKSEGLEAGVALAEFYRFGFRNHYAIAAEHNQGIYALTEALNEHCPSPDPAALINEEEELDPELAAEEARVIKVAIVGRPNVGKSTLINRIVGEERSIVSNLAGTTRDSLYIPFQHRGDEYMLIDTAGVRRRSKVHEVVEKFSVIKTLKAIDDSHVVVMMLDAQGDGLVDQDLHLLSYIIESGRSLVIAVNKWDNLESYDKEQMKENIERKLHFVSFAKVCMISALHGTAVGDLYALIKRAHRSAFLSLSTSKVNELLELITTRRPPPLAGKRRAKFRYAHFGGHNPPTIVIHGTHLSSLTQHYQRYLSNAFREALRLEGTPLQIRLAEKPAS